MAGGLEAAKPAIRELCRAQDELAEVAAKPVTEFPVFLEYQDDVYAAVAGAVGDEVAEALKIAGKAEREEALDRIKAAANERVAGQFEGREKEISAAFRSLTKKEVRARVLRDQVRIDGRGPRDIRPLTAEVQVLPRVHGSALFERGRDPDPGRHHAEHAAHGADAGHPGAGEVQAVHAQLQLPAVLDR